MHGFFPQVAEEYYSSHDLERIRKAKTFAEIREVVLEVMARWGGNFCIVCGPMTSGGVGDFKRNLVYFGRAINWLVDRGERVLTQLSFENRVQQLKTKPRYRDGRKLMPELYEPIFRSSLIVRAYFIPTFNDPRLKRLVSGWESSTGARFEHKLCQKLKIPIEYLPQAAMQFTRA